MWDLSLASVRFVVANSSWLHVDIIVYTQIVHQNCIQCLLSSPQFHTRAPPTYPTEAGKCLQQIVFVVTLSLCYNRKKQLQEVETMYWSRTPSI